jgi:hypothetical protein
VKEEETYMLRSVSLILALTGISTVSVAAENPCKDVESSSPVYDKSGEFQGCKLIKVAAGSLYEKLGIKAGDIVHPPGYPAKVSQGKAIQLSGKMKESAPSNEN